MFKSKLFEPSILLIVSILLMISVALSDERSFVQEASVQTRAENWSGCFYEILGPHQQSFEEFINFYVISFPDQSPSGGLSTKLKKSALAFATIRVSGDRLSFTTVSFKGIKYSFEGQLRRKPRIESGEIVREPIAEGTLRKYRRGRQVAKSKVSLACIAGDD